MLKYLSSSDWQFQISARARPIRNAELVKTLLNEVDQDLEQKDGPVPLSRCLDTPALSAFTACWAENWCSVVSSRALICPRLSIHHISFGNDFELATRLRA